MSPNGQMPGAKPVASSNIYTAVLAIALGAVVATAVLVAYKCMLHYGTLFKIP